MQSESILGQLRSFLQQKEGVVYRKAQTIITSMEETAFTLPSLTDDRSVTLFYLGNCYRLLERQAVGGHHVEPLLLLIHHFLPKTNFKLISSTNIIPGLIKKLTNLLENKLTPMTLKYTMAILTEILSSHDNPMIFWETVGKLINISLSGTDFLHRQATKSIEVILEKQHILRNASAQSIKKTIQQNLEDGKQTYLTHLNGSVKLFPIELMNDMLYIVKRKLRDDENIQQLTQMYFFLDAVFENNLVTSSVSEEILKQLIQNTPTDHENDRLMSGYMQALYENIIHLNESSLLSARRYISTCVSIFSELLLLREKISKQAESLFKEMLIQCVRKHLWTVDTNDELMGLEDMEIEDTKVNPFVKVVCMLNDLLTTRYADIGKRVLNVLMGFAEGLDETAFVFVKDFIVKLQNQRESFPINVFSELFGTIVKKLQYRPVLQIYPVTVNGDPSSSQFDESNNLWLLPIVGKECDEAPLNIFIRYFLPVIIDCSNKALHQQILLKRNIYLNILKRLWDLLSVFHIVDRSVSYDEAAFLLNEIQKNLNTSYDHFDNVVRGLAELVGHLANMKLEKKAEKLIPVLAKLLDMDSPLSQSILKSMASLSQICSSEYLDRVYDKNIIKLITAKNSKQLNTPQCHNNLEILIAISHGVNFNDSKVLSNGYSKEETALKLIEGLMTEDNTFQKKAYKYLFQAIEYMPKGFLTEALTLLDNNSALLFSKSYRLNFLKICWQRLNFDSDETTIEDMLQFVKKYLPEIVVSLREANYKLRKSASSLFRMVIVRMNKLNILENFLEMVCSGLAGHSVTMKTDTIHALTLALDEVNMENCQKFILELTDVLLVMLKQGKREIYKAVLLYLKELFHHKLEKSKQVEIMPNIIKVLFEEDEDSRMANINILRHFLLKLTKKHSQQKITQMLPEEHRKLVKAVVKAETRLKKKKRENAKRKRSVGNEKNPEESDAESEEEVEEEENRMEEEIDEQAKEKEEKAKKNNLLLKYDLHKEDFHFVEEKRRKSAEKKKKSAQDDEQAGVSYADGRIIFRQVTKRGRQQNEQSDEEEVNQPTKRRRIIKSIQLSQVADTIHQIKQSGSSYKSARSGGDVRVKNKPEPYAFIQLNSKALNRRYRHKAQKVFESIFEKKQGGLRGLKTRLLAK